MKILLFQLHFGTAEKKLHPWFSKLDPPDESLTVYYILNSLSSGQHKALTL